MNAWIGGNKAAGVPVHFRLDGDRFGLSRDVAPELAEPLAALLQELVDVRFASYESRLESQPMLQNSGGKVVKTGRTDAEETRSLPPDYGQPEPGGLDHRQRHGHRTPG